MGWADIQVVGNNSTSSDTEDIHSPLFLHSLHNIAAGQQVATRMHVMHHGVYGVYVIQINLIHVNTGSIFSVQSHTSYAYIGLKMRRKQNRKKS